jgi:2-polyprenyl-3-methyl-5-hydroxy-6-metoxy-1,4-benzoquinol methylase
MCAMSFPPEFDVICDSCDAPIRLSSPPASHVACPACGRRYDASAGILRLCGASAPLDYSESHYGALVPVEERHPWFRARSRALLHALRATGSLRGRTVLDVGCGTGLLLAGLERAGMIGCGVDMNVAGLEVARRRVRGQLIRAAAGRVPVRGPVDLIVLGDVLEHVDDDVSLLRAAAERVGDDGHIAITVPADPRLWSAVDEISGHKRRYSASDLRRSLRDAGLMVVSLRHFNSWLWPLLLVRRLRWKPGSVQPSSARARDVVRANLATPPAPLAAAADLVAAIEISAPRSALPFGASLVALARRARAGHTN